jgi:hypothetical protein
VRDRGAELARCDLEGGLLGYWRSLTERCRTSPFAPQPRADAIAKKDRSQSVVLLRLAARRVQQPLSLPSPTVRRGSAIQEYRKGYPAAPLPKILGRRRPHLSPLTEGAAAES